MAEFYLNNSEIEMPGDQPTRIFYSQILVEFEQIKKLLTENFLCPELSLLKLSFLTENIKVIGPSINKSRIEIHDSFLTFLWCYCYGSIINMPSGAKTFSEDESDKAYALLQYSKEIVFSNFSEWPKHLPNPENQKGHNENYIALANAVFMASLITILFHEFAHYVLGHLNQKDRSIQKMREMEYQADMFAIDYIRKTTSFNEITVNCAIVLAISSLALSVDKLNDNSNHPEPEDRLTKGLLHLNLPYENHIWNLATWTLMEWMIYFGRFGNSSDLSDKRHFYFAIVKEIKNSKLLNLDKNK